MVTKRCQWGRCNSDSRYKHKEYMKNVFFIPFPKPTTQLTKCLEWIKKCGRPHEQLNVDKIDKYKYVCSKHFVGGKGPTQEFPDPVTADPYDHQKPRKRPLEREPLPMKPKVLKSSFKETLNENLDTTLTVTSIFNRSQDMDIEVKTESCSTHEQNIEAKSSFSGISCDMCGNSLTSDQNKMKQFKRRLFVREILTNDENCFHYTGVPTVQVLKDLFAWIEPAAKDIKLWGGKRKMTPLRKQGRRRKTLSLFEEYLLTLVRIKRGFGIKHLEYLFGVSESHISRIFTTWVNLLAKCFEQLIVWPSKNIVQGNLPNSFKAFPNTRCIIDCSELFVEKPFRPMAQRITWSNYKHSNTFKFLVGIIPTGTITFISKLYSGSISDHAIVEESKFVDRVEEGDDIMADRGFNIRHLLLRKKATLNIPAFSHGKNLSSKAIKRSRKTASIRIHVERAIRRMKIFKILSGIIPLKLRYLLNQILKIVVILCNLQVRLVKH